MPNLINALNNLVSPELLGQAAVHLGESSDSVTKAGSGIISSLVASTLEKGDDSGLEKVLQASGLVEDVIKNSLGEIFNGNISDIAKEAGASFLGNIMGDKLGDFSGLVSKDYELKSASANSLIGMIAPVVSSYLGGRMNDMGTGITGLAKELANEKDAFVPNIPAGFAGILGLSSLTLLGNRIISGASNIATGAIDLATGAVEGAADVGADIVEGAGKAVTNAAGVLGDGAKKVTGDVTGAISNVADGASDVVGNVAESVGDVSKGAVKGASSILSWLLPLALVIGGVLLLIYLLRSCNNENANATGDDNNTTMVDSTATDSTATEGGEKESTELTLPSGAKIQAYKGGIEDQMITFLQSDEYKNATQEQLEEKWFNFDNVNFEFGKTDQLTPESETQVTNVVAIMKEFPDAHIKLGAYTDKVGADATNKSLSQKRADYLKKRFADAGIAGQINGAKGFGEEFAQVPEDASDEERAKDRHMSLRFDKTEAAAEAPAQ